MKQDQIEKHSITQSIFLHLLPGIMVGCFYFLALKPVARMGFPSFFAQFLAFAFIPVHRMFFSVAYSCHIAKKVISGLRIQSAPPACRSFYLAEDFGALS